MYPFNAYIHRLGSQGRIQMTHLPKKPAGPIDRNEHTMGHRNRSNTDDGAPLSPKSRREGEQRTSSFRQHAAKSP